MDLSLEDLLPEYPDIQEEDFQQQIGRLYEFQELRPAPNDIPPQRLGEYYKHQQIVQRYLRVYDRLLVCHDPGTGKTCTVVGVCEYFKHNPQHINHVYVLAKGATLLAEIKNQILCRCTPGDYITDNVRNNKGAAQKSAITTSIKRWYTLFTYDGFVKEVRKLYWNGNEPDVEAIKRDLSGKFFWIDEGHNLRLNDVYNYEDDVTAGVEPAQKELWYSTLHTIFHIVERSKVVITTATPMINQTSEIGPLMNLLLPLDNQFPKGFDYDGASLEEFYRYFKGHVSYVRALETGALANYLGQPLSDFVPESSSESVECELNRDHVYQTIVYPTYMSEFQSAAYEASKTYRFQKTAARSKIDITELETEESRVRRQAQQKESERLTERRAARKRRAPRAESEETTRSGVYTSERQVTSAVFPDGSFGREGFERYITGKDGKYRATPELADALSTIDGIKELSCKYGDFAERFQIVNGVPKTPGNVFCYFEFTKGSGLVYFSLVLEALGYSKFTETQSIFIDPEGGYGAAGNDPCFVPKPGTVGRKTRIEKKPRYAVISGDTKSNVFYAMMEAMNSYENTHGEYIKILISSPTGRDGLNVNNVLNVEIFPAEWNPSATLQALSRALRATSHGNLIREKQAAGDYTPLPVNIRLHVALDENQESVDLDMYKISESKGVCISRVWRFLKQSAIDCWLNYDKNVRPGEDGSPGCDYQECEYKCIDPPPEDAIYNNYDIMYIGEKLEIIAGEIIEYFRGRFTATLEEIYAHFPKYEHKYIDLAIELANEKRYPVIDRFGFKGYLYESGGIVFIGREYPNASLESKSIYSLHRYVETFVVEKIYTLTRVQEMRDVQENKLLNLDPQDPRFDSIVNSLPVVIQVQLLETALQNTAAGKETPLDARIKDKYSFFWWDGYVPEARIEAIAKKIGRNKLMPKVEGLKEDQLQRVQIPTSGKKVYVHMMWLILEGLAQTQYNIMSKLKNAKAEKYRVFQPGVDPEFRDAAPYEYLAYNEIFQKIFDSIDKKYSTDPETGEPRIYGITFQKVFRIVVPSDDEKKTDGRTKTRGKLCSSNDIPPLVSLLVEAGVPAPNIQVSDSKETLIRDLSASYQTEFLKTLSKSQLQDYTRWIRSTKVRSDDEEKIKLCDIMASYLRETGRMLEL